MKRKRGVLVLDPMFDEWECSYKSADQDEFLQTFWASRCCDVFIDEAGDSIGQYDRAMFKTATKGRHWGHNCHFITQRGAQLSPTVRTQCHNLFLFAMAREDTKILALEWNKPELMEAASLPAGQCFLATRFGEVKRLNVFN